MSDELRRHMIDEPDTVGAAVEDVAFAVHLAGQDRQQHRFPMSCTDFESHLRLRGKMHMMAIHFEQALGADGFEETSRGAVVEEFGRLLWSILQLNLDRMPLTRPDAQPIGTELEPLLRVRDDDMLQIVARERFACLVASGEQRGDIDPSGGIERDMRRRRFMPQHEAEELAGAGGLGGRHGEL